MAERNPVSERFRIFACKAAARVGSHWAFMIAVATILVWALTGPIFHFDETWQLVINTGTTIVTFLMVFLIQTTQNRDAKALHLKLDELIRITRARNVFAGLEDASEEELDRFQAEFAALRAREAAARHESQPAARRGQPSHLRTPKGL